MEQENSRHSGTGPGIDAETNFSRAPGPETRWIAYLSPDRRVLWSERHGGDSASESGRRLPPYKESVPGSRFWRTLVDAVFSTRIPQCGMRRVDVDGREENLMFKAFPDFGADGRLRGVVQVVEKATEKPAAAILDRPFQINDLLDLSLSGMAVYDAGSDLILEANGRLAQETGYAVEELRNMPGKVLFGNDGAALLHNLCTRMAAAGTSMIWGQLLALRNRRGEGETYFASMRAVPDVRAGKGRCLMQMLLNVADIDRMTGRLREGPTPRFAYEALRDGLWEYDLNRHVFHYSASFADIYGPDGLPGGPGKAFDDWAESTYRGETEKIFAKWRQLVKRGARYHTEYRVRDVSGQWRWVMATIHAVVNDLDGRPSRMIGFHADITDAVRSDRELADMEERLRVIFEGSGLGIALCRTDGRIESVNPALAVMLGRNREDFEGNWLHPFAEPESQEEMLPALARLQRGGRRETMTELLFRREDGREVWVNITATLSREVSDGARYMILMFEDVTAGRAKREKLQYEATHDVMTGAWSRWIVLERLGQHIGLALRYGQPMAFCICDLDHFKRVNDMYGHQAGDRVLVRFVEILKESVRDTEVVGRYGGEEFAVVFPNTTAEGAAQSMERALELLRGESFDAGAGQVFHVTATFGVSAARPGCDLKQVVAWADTALYEGKGSGRGRVIVGSPDFCRLGGAPSGDKTG